MSRNTSGGLVAAIENAIFGNRKAVIAFFVIISAIMVFLARGLHIDAGFTKTLPTKHPYMQTYLEYQEEFGGANRIIVALVDKNGDIFNPKFFTALKEATDVVSLYLPGVDRAKVSSLFTPNVRFIEVVEDGLSGGNVVPADFQPTDESIDQVRQNILKAKIVGRLVANDFSGAIISAQLLETNPETGEPLDLVDFSHQLDEKVRDVFEDEDIGVHIIGFAKVLGDVTDGAQMVVVFFLVAFLITALLVFLYTRSLWLSAIPLVCSVIAVLWQLGMLTGLGFGIDPFGIIVPFLVFAIAVSHGVQMVTAVRAEVFDGLDSMAAARASFRKLAVPGIIALLSDTVGFITIYYIEIRVIQEMAITASIGVASIILTNLVLLPVLMSYVSFSDEYKAKLVQRAERLDPLWQRLSGMTRRGPATAAMMVALLLLGVGYWKGANIKIGDLQSGVPELRETSRYNIDTQMVTDRFSIGVDIISTIVEAGPEACIDYAKFTNIDQFAWYMDNVEGVQSTISLSKVAKIVNAGWNEGSLKWRILSRNQANLVQATNGIDTSSGLLNADCSVMPVMIFTEDHKAETIARVVDAVKQWNREYALDGVEYRLATGNVGVMAATNEEVSRAQFPILIGVFAVIILLCLLTFRSLMAVLCIVLPLGLVSLLAYALMTTLEIGLKVSTLPVVALGVGIGVDYGIYIFSRIKGFMDEGASLDDAFLSTLKITGAGVVFTGLTLAIGVATWLFSPLKFQADMGLLLTFMFLVNMLGAILLLPALAHFLLGKRKPDTAREG
ncbi:MAG: MMPL family transporter [Pseudomonadota bacterium]